MKRSIIVFLIAFLATLGAAAGLYFLLPGKFTRQAPKPAPEPAATAKPAPAADTKPAPAGTGADKPEEQATPPQTEPAPGPTADEQKKDIPGHGLRREPKTHPTLPQPAETARDAEHSLALVTAEVLKGGQVEETLQHMVERGLMTPEAARALAAWAKAHRVKSVEEVGTTQGSDGSRTTRFRLTSEDGKGDMLLSVVTSRDGTVRVETAAETTSDKTELGSGSDPLSVAEGFLAAVKSGDMGKARSMVTGEEVSNATIAGLCMLFDEGEFALREDSPIRGTFANDSHAGYLAYLTDLAHPEDKSPLHIGLEMLRKDGSWRVSAVALDSLLSSYEESAHAEGGRYFPIVKNPKGGDSLALFFAFNESELTPRSMRQLRIVAELLKESQGSLNISGHTDDVGSEAYNQQLSERRAMAVKDALVSYGVRAEQITTHGLGKSQPRRTYNTDDSESEIDYIRGENRRAEIYLDFQS